MEKGERLWSGEGIAIYATDQAEALVLEFQAAEVCEAAYRLQALLKSHTLSSSFLERLDSRSFLIRRVEPLPVQLAAEAEAGTVRLELQRTADGGPLSREEALQEPGLSPKRLERMEDVATHAARSLRAHLSLQGVERLRMALRFGITHDGACLMQVVNPLVCDLGVTDMGRLAQLLGG